MSDFQAQIRERIERQMRQRQGKVEQSSLDLSFYKEIEAMKESYQKESESNHRYIENDELQLQLRKERESLHQYQMASDKLRIRMIQITKEESCIREAIGQKRTYYSGIKVKIEKDHKVELEKLEKQYQTKKQGILQQIQGLIGQKGQLLTEVQKVAEQIKKADARNKRAKEDYDKQMKSKKEAFIALQRAKFAKFQQTRVQQLKDKAALDLQPKLLAIIKSSKDDVTKAKQVQEKKLEEFKIEYKMKLQKDLTDSKKRISQQLQEQKQQKRLQIQRKYKEKYHQKEIQLENELTALKEQYADRIKDEERKMRADVEQFIMRNKETYNSNIEEIKQLKSTYETKLKQMNENIKELKGNKLIQYEEKYKRQFEEQMKAIDLKCQQRYKIAQQKIKKDITDNINKIKNEIIKQKNQFGEDINKKYEKILLQQRNKMEEAQAKEKKSIEQYQAKIIELQKQRSKQQAKAQQMQKQRNNLMTKNEDLERKIATHQAQMQAFERLKLQKEKQSKKKCDEYGKKMQQKFQQLKNIYLKKEDQKQNRLKELMDEFQAQNRSSQDELYNIRQQVQQKVRSMKQELKRILQQNSRLDRQNDFLQRQIEQQSKKIRT